MLVYKIKHIPTGLYYTPSKGNGNLSAKGKMYSTKPTLAWVSQIRITIYSCKKSPTGTHKIIVDYFKFDWNSGYINEYVKTKHSDWEIVEL